MLLSTDILRFRFEVLVVVNFNIYISFSYTIYWVIFAPSFFRPSTLVLQTISPYLEFAQTMEYTIHILFLINSKLRIVLNSPSLEFAQ